MRAGRLDPEDLRILADGCDAVLWRYRQGWATSPRGPFRHGRRVSALVAADLMTRAPGAEGPRVWTTQAGRDLVSAPRDGSAA